LAVYEQSLFEEDFEAWEYGPVLPSVYHYFKKFGSGPIYSDFSKLIMNLDPVKQKFLNQIYTYFGQFSAGKLMRMTHEETPWMSTKPSGTISKERLKSFFKDHSYCQLIFDPIKSEQLSKAAELLLADYHQDPELNVFSSLDAEYFYETE
jgi:uncharacterized phage-associated protein